MIEIIKDKREYFYAVLFFVLFEFAIIAYQNAIPTLFWSIAIISAWIMFVWSIFSYMMNSKRVVSTQSVAIIEFKMLERVVPYFITPLLLISVAFIYLYFEKNSVLQQITIFMTSTAIWASMVFIRNSYRKMYSVDQLARVIFKFADLLLFFLSVSILYLYPIDEILRIIVVISVAAVLLMHQLKLYGQSNLDGYAVYIISMTIFAALYLVIQNFYPFYQPLMLTVLFYVIMTLWYLKMSGVRAIGEYLTPIMFGLMAVIALLSL